jgi:hypothetical protein
LLLLHRIVEEADAELVVEANVAPNVSPLPKARRGVEAEHLNLAI